ncbi:MAG: hypothetical protein ACE5F1_19050 [Planctomycetota bacterium]
MKQFEKKSALPDLVHDLARVLREQEGEVAAITQALREERRSFVSYRSGDIQSAQSRIEERASRCLTLDEERSAILKSMAEILGVPPTTLTAARIAACVTGNGGAGLKDQARRTRRAAEALQIETRLGNRLLEWSARCHEGLIYRLAEALDPPRTYERSGRQMKEGQRIGLVDGVF